MPIQGRGVPIQSPGQRQTLAGSNYFPDSLSGGPDNGAANLRDFTFKQFRRFNFDLSTARSLEEFQVSGTFLWIADASSSSAVIEVAYNQPDNGALIPLTKGASISGAPFNKVFVTHAAQASESLAIVIATDSPGDRVIVT